MQRPPTPPGSADRLLGDLLRRRYRIESGIPVVPNGLQGQDGCMINDPSPEPRDSGTPSAQAPESYSGPWSHSSW